MTDDRIKKVVVTGGAGYIGSVLVGQLLNSGYRVKVIDRLTFGGESLSNFKDNQNFSLSVSDISDYGSVRDELNGFDAVVHLAAIVGDPACKKYPDEAVKVNRIGSNNLLEAAFENNLKRFVFASTCSNYGKMPDPNGFVNEETELNPVSLYAELKVEFEEKLLSLDEEIVPVVLRFATAFGLSYRPRFDLTVNEFTKELVLNRKLDIYGEQFWRPYCHTTDLARACCLMLGADQSEVSTEAFNVGSNEENYQKKTLVEKILKLEPDKKDNVSYIKKEEDLRDYRVNFDKISNCLNFEINRTVDDGIFEIRKALLSSIIENPDSEKYRNI